MTVAEQFSADPYLQVIRDGMRGAAETPEESAFVDWFLGLPVSTGDYDLNFVLKNLFQDVPGDRSILTSQLTCYGSALVAELHRQFRQLASSGVSAVIQNSPPSCVYFGLTDFVPDTKALVPVVLKRPTYVFSWPFTIASEEPHG